jgi:hypothetical protein
LLDKLTGARALRGLLGGRPEELLSILPGSDTFGLTNEENSLSGRDLLEQYGALSPNQPGLDLGDVGGFLAEVALDPSAWASFGATSVAKNLLPDAATSALRYAGNLPSAPTRYAAGKVGQGVDYVKKTNVGGEISRNLDALIDPTVRGATTEAVIPSARKYSGDLEKIRPMVRMGETDVAAILREHDALQNAPELRMAVEGVQPATNPGVQQAAQKIREWDDDLLARQKAVGLTNEGLYDAAGVLHGARKGVKSASGTGKGGKAFDTYNPFLKKREGFLKHIVGGTELGVKPIVKDEKIIQAATPLDARKYIEKTYGDKFLVPKMSPELATAMAAQQSNGLNGLHALKQIIKEEKKAHRKLLKTDPNAAQSALQIQATGALKNRRKELTSMAGWIRNMPDDQRTVGYFDRHPLFDATESRMAGETAIAASENILDALSKTAASGLPADSSRSLREVLQASNLRGRGALDTLAQKMGIDRKDLKRMRVPAAEADEITKALNAFTSPKAAGLLGRAFDSYTSLFKFGVLTAPARYVRDFTTAFYLNTIDGVGLKHSKDAAALVAKESWASRFLNRGKSDGLIADASKRYPIVGQILQQRGLADTPENATQVLRDLIYAHQVVGKRTRDTTRAAGVPETAATTIADYEKQFVGSGPAGFGHSMSQLGDLLKSREAWNPFKMSGVMDLQGGVQDVHKFAPAKAGDELSYFTDSMGRIPMFLSELEKGVDPLAAANKVRETHVDYRPEAFTATEGQVRRFVPFLAWQRKMVPYVLKKLWDKPGGGIGQSIRAQGALQEDSEDTYIPRDLQAMTAVPWGGMDEKGSQRFLTGLGLPQEAVLENVALRPTFGGTLEHSLQKLGSQLHPLLKAPIEYSLGKQFFGGRELADLDSPTERLMKNVAGDSPDIPIWMDQAISNSPFTRLLGTARTLTDERKEGWAKGLNLLTGVRVTDADLPRRLEAEIRESSAELLAGQSKSFESIFVPKRTLEALEASDPDNWGPQGSKRRLLQLYQQTSR